MRSSARGLGALGRWPRGLRSQSAPSGGPRRSRCGRTGDGRRRGASERARLREAGRGAPRYRGIGARQSRCRGLLLRPMIADAAVGHARGHRENTDGPPRAGGGPSMSGSTGKATGPSPAPCSSPEIIGGGPHPQQIPTTRGSRPARTTGTHRPSRIHLGSSEHKVDYRTQRCGPTGGSRWLPAPALVCTSESGQLAPAGGTPDRHRHNFIYV